MTELTKRGFGYGFQIKFLILKYGKINLSIKMGKITKKNSVKFILSISDKICYKNEIFHDLN
jgi:hypothetical protein